MRRIIFWRESHPCNTNTTNNEALKHYFLSQFLFCPLFWELRQFLLEVWRPWATWDWSNKENFASINQRQQKNLSFSEASRRLIIRTFSPPSPVPHCNTHQLVHSKHLTSNYTKWCFHKIFEVHGSFWETLIKH